MSTHRHQLAVTRHRRVALAARVHVGAAAEPTQAELATKGNLVLLGGGAVAGILIFTGSPFGGAVLGVASLVVGASMKG